jgi:hypothetical protein
MIRSFALSLYRSVTFPRGVRIGDCWHTDWVVGSSADNGEDEGKSKCVERRGKSEPARKMAMSFLGNERRLGGRSYDESWVGRVKSSPTGSFSDNRMGDMACV